MKSKRRLIISIFFAVFIYLCIVKASDIALDSSQSNHFDIASESYADLRNSDKEVRKTLLQKNGMQVSKFNTSSDNNKLNDLWDRKIIKPDGEITKTSSLMGRDYYKAKQINDDEYLILHHHSQRLWNHHWAYFSLLSVIYLLLAIIIVRLIYLAGRRRDYEIALITENIKKIGAGDEITPMIVQNNDSFTPLVLGVQKLNKIVSEKDRHNHLLSRRFKGLVGHLPVGVMLLDEQGNVLVHNQTMSVILGQNISDDEHPYIDDIKTYSLSRMIEHTLRKNKNYHKSLHLIGNSNRFVDANVVRISHSNEDMERQVIVILYDLTEIKQVEQMQMDFVGNVSHELKTPITAINGFTETLINGAKDNPEDLDKFLTIINKESKRLNSLVQDILELSQIDDDNEFEDDINLKDIVDDAKNSLSQIISDKNIQLNTKISGTEVITSSKMMIEEIIDNLLTNSVIYNKENGKVDLVINHDEVKNTLNITIEDTGIGISEENIDRIFERFYRVDKSHSQEIEGTGLGLSIVANAVNNLNGNITVDSQLAVGTKFKINIPL
ncbi:signal transduction histidine kinase [Companilactobacillus sp. RD055328]|uniref:sensor histidine kinase n=1 Tax=Companilactobacillus sp. RD055328 TaxID=2916634 RepID=UPI001FC8C897|nr:ATP-binding protein [Companilactobacillus sp. RD055328]GKQ43055.1 signal transduction histidine kinase [Companilactobacillus sp. RD055328]